MALYSFIVVYKCDANIWKTSNEFVQFLHKPIKWAYLAFIWKDIRKDKTDEIWINSTFIVENWGTESLIEALWLSHGALDVERSDVLPVLLQQRHQEVHSQVDVVDQLFLSHPDVTNSHSQTQNLNMTEMTIINLRNTNSGAKKI